MTSLQDKIIVAVGGTGNVGSFIVQELLNSGAQVVVPSRSEEKIASLREHLRELNREELANLHTFAGTISDEESAEKLLDQITKSVGMPDGAISSLGRFIPAPSLLTVEMGDMRTVMENYFYAHYAVARVFLPLFKDNGGSFVFVNGPLAMKPRQGAAPVSIATAAQQMLFKALAQELKETKAIVSELMTYAFIRNRQTQPQSKVSGEAVGALASWMVSGEATGIHGETIHLNSMEKLEELGVESPVQ